MHKFVRTVCILTRPINATFLTITILYKGTPVISRGLRKMYGKRSSTRGWSSYKRCRSIDIIIRIMMRRCRFFYSRLRCCAGLLCQILRVYGIVQRVVLVLVGIGPNTKANGRQENEGK